MLKECLSTKMIKKSYRRT